MLRNNPIQRIVLFFALFQLSLSGDHDFTRKRRLVQPTKKKDCQAKLRIRHIIKVPDFKVYKQNKI